MAEAQTHGRVYADLVSGLLDARADPATDRFDRELDAAVAAGEVSAELARRLRFWQRASLRALTDHTRTVLPTALDALQASRHDAQTYVDELQAALGDRPVEDADSPDATLSVPDSDTTITLHTTIDLEGPRPRLLVAGLVPATEHDTRAENR